MKRKWQRNWKQRLMKKLAMPVLAGMMLFSSYNSALANPAGGVVTAGAAAISTSGSTLTVNQTTNKAAINWQSFGIGRGETVRFVQPSASSVALNRVVGGNASAIYGTLSANGKVFLVNPSGILFAPGSQVNVGGLVASTLNMSDSDFLKGNYSFAKNGAAGSVVNQGTIRTADGGYVAFLGPQVRNEGIVAAQTVGLAAGDKVSLDFDGDKLLSFRVDTQAAGAAATNSGSLLADGGTVVMSTGTKDALLSTVVNNTGLIQARTVNSVNGKIILEGGAVNVGGTLDASGLTAGQTGGTLKVLGDNVTLASGSLLNASGDAGGGTILVGGAYQGGAGEYAATRTTVAAGATLSADAATTGNGGKVVVWSNDTTDFGGTITARGGSVAGDGGSVETSGKQTLKVKGTAKVSTLANRGKTGNWLLDPKDFTVAPSGGDRTGAKISEWLASTNVTIQTTATTSSVSRNGNLVGNGQSGTEGNININDAITWTSDTTLTLSAYNDININEAITWSRGTALSLSAGNNININRSITNTGAGSLALEYGQKDVSANNTSTYSINAPVNLTAGQHFSTKLGTGGTSTQYTVITSLDALQGINASTESRALNYFLGADIDAGATSGWNSNAGFAPIGADSSSAFTGAFDGGGHTISGLTINRPEKDYVGLFGFTEGSVIDNISLVNASIKGKDQVGALAGMITANSQITNSSATGSVTGGDYVGGLVGSFFSGTISNSYAAGSVKGSTWVGGLVGTQAIGSISNSYATGSVTGDAYVGGLVGSNSNDIISSYATGSVTGQAIVGGLVGYNNGAISSSYATGKVTGTGINDKVGGLVGQNNNSGAITNSYWDVDTTTKTAGVGYNANLASLGYTALYSNGGASSTAFTENSYDGFDFGNTWYMVDGSTRPFLRSEYSTNITNAHQLQLMAMDLTANYTLGKNIDMSELAQAAGMWRTSSTADGSGSYGFAPIGTGETEATAFSGSFDGGGHTISGLTINRPTEDYVGLFGSAHYYNEMDPGYSKKIANVGLAGASITGKDNVGALAGYTSYTSITNSYITAGSVIGNNNVGGLAGNAGSIANSHAAAKVTGVANVGGLAGYLTGLAEATYATGEVTGTGTAVGGLAGYVHTFGAIQKSYASGAVIGKGKVGGLVGNLNAAQGDAGIHDSYATGSVAGTGTDAGSDYVGGLAGYVGGSGIFRSYSTGLVSGAAVAGLVGGGQLTGAKVSSNYWNTETSGVTKGFGSVANMSGMAGLTTADLMSQLYSSASFSNSNTSTVWGSVYADGVAASYPYLKWRYSTTPQVVSGTLTADNVANASGKTIQVAANGSGFGGTATGANGFYYLLLDNNTIANNAAVLSYWSGQGSAAKYATAANQSLTGFDITAGKVTASSGGALDVTALLAAAKGNIDAGTRYFVSVGGGNIAVDGGLDVTAGGAVTQSGFLTVTGATTVNAANGATKYDITLNNAANNFTGRVALTGNNVTLRDGNALWLGGSTISGDLNVTAGGDVTQTGGLTVTGATTVNAGSHNISLWNTANNFGGAVTLTGNNVALRDANDLTLGISNVGGYLSVLAGGAVTQSGALTVTGVTSINAGAYDITLNNAANDFTGKVSLAGRNVTLRDGNALCLDGSTISGDLNVTAGGGVTQTVGLSVTGATSVNVGTNDIILNNSSNNFTGAVSLTGQNVALRDANDLTLGAVTAPGSFTLSAGGNITANSAVNTGIFDLKGGSWSQVNDTLPPFSATDFRISGGSFLRALGGDGTSGSPYRISDIYGLQGIGSSAILPTTYYSLANNIDASATSTWNSGAGFKPIGTGETDATAFTGNFNGGGHTISNLTINRPSEDYIGLFGAAGTGTLDNVKLTSANVTGQDWVGALAGYTLTSSNIYNSHATGSVTGRYHVGGLAGYTKSNVENSHAAVTVNGNGNVGGLVGYAYSGDIFSSYATGNVTGTGNNVGGLVGYALNASIRRSYAGGNVSGQDNLGGLVGLGLNSISSSYASGNVTGAGNKVGGLVGYFSGAATSSYATGSVTGSTNVGGLVGYNSGGTVTSSYWDIGTSGQATSAGGTGLTSAQMRGAGNFSGWADLVDGSGNKVWYFYDGLAAPLLRSFLTPLTVTVAGTNPTVEYNRTAYTTIGDVSYDGTHSGLLGELSYGKVVNDAYTANAGNAGTYSLGGLYSGQQGYAITYAGATGLTITPKALTITATSANKVYDGTTGSAAIPTYTGLMNGDTLDGLAQTYGSKNALGANGSTLNVSAYTLTDGNTGGNYTVVKQSAAGTITPASLTITATSANKVYDGTTGSTATPTYTGLMNGDSLSGLAQTYANKNVLGASGSTLNVGGYTLSDGNNGGNYTVATQSAAGTITPATLTTNLTGTVEKVYDGTKAGTLTSANYTALAGIFHSDDVTLAIATSGLYVDKNAGEGKSVTVTGLGLSGSAAANYQLASTLSGNVGKITPKTLTTGLTGTVEKVYDGTNTAILSGANYTSLAGIVGSDAVSLDIATSGQYADKNVNLAGDKAVTVSGFGLSGADAGNYQLASTLSGNIGKITPATLTITANNASRQIGVENPVFSSTHTGLVAGDNLASLTGLISYATPATKDSPAGTYAITPSGLTSENYTIAWVDGVLTVNRPTDAYVSALGTVAGLAAAPPPMPMLIGTGVTRIDATTPASGATSGANAGTTDASETPAGSTGTPSSSNPAAPPMLITQVPGLPLTFTGPGINTGGHPVIITAEQE